MDTTRLPQSQSPQNQPDFNSHPHGTKLCLIIDSRTPIIMKVPIAPQNLTLGRFKQLTALQSSQYKFYFKSQDSEFGVVKEEVIDDKSCLPVDGDRIVAWVISNDANQTSLFQTSDSVRDESESIVYENIGHTTTMRQEERLYCNIPRQSNIHYQSDSHTLRNKTQDTIFIRVQLNLDKYNFLGLTLVGPSDETGSGDRGIHVGEIKKNSVVEQDGRIQIGDRIVDINGIDLTHMRNDDAVAIFKKYVERRGAINILVERNLRIDVSSRSHFTLPREYANIISHPSHAALANCKSRHQYHEGLPIPVFDSDQSRLSTRPDPVPIPPNRIIHRGTYSLPRSITPRSLYASSNFENFQLSDDTRRKLDSRSAYEPTTPTSLRQFDVALHCGRDDIHTIYTALKNDAKSLDIKDREWLKVIVKNAFLGSILVKWLSRNVYGFGHKREIKRYANQMLSMGLIKNPMSSGAFSEKCYYTLS